jgi:hypothetical protein
VNETFSARFAQLAWRHGVSGSEVALLAGGLNLARSFKLSCSSSGSLQRLLSEVADRLHTGAEWDGRGAAADWLRHPSIPGPVLDRLAAGVDALLDSAPDKVNWDNELGAVLESVGHRGEVLGLPLAIAIALQTVLAIPESGVCACLFGPTATIAWTLSETRPVRLYVGEPDVARLFSMFAVGAGRRLIVDRRNPLEGSFMPSLSDMGVRDRSPVVEVDYILSVPPFGLRVRDTDGSPVSIEAIQLDRLRRFARREFVTIIPDGFLFREGRREVQIRRELIESGTIEVDSLPPGIFGRVSGVSTAVLRVVPEESGQVRFVDGRTMRAQSSGKVQQRLLLQHLASWPEIRSDKELIASVPVKTVAENNFVLMPDRYVRPAALQAVHDAAAELRHVQLSEVAAIERTKAPRPLHDAEEEPWLVCREIAPSDIHHGVVGEPRRTVNFAENEAQRAKSLVVRDGDILVSIKGNVGIVGIVPDSAPQADADEPWIISQSLAIIRYRSNPHIPSPEVLNAILTAPWVRQGLERLAGGSTVRTLSMGDLRQFEVPLLEPREFEAVGKVLNLVAEKREEIRARIASIDSHQRRIWNKLWGMNPDQRHDMPHA